ncbi:MAG: hypothetical protein ORN83_16880, partial [Chthoniobacteraceae bacterium]|nr:hypothetical protein [Chthoniobacteraceae bacterium]
AQGRTEAEMGLAKILAERLVHLQAQSPAGPDQAALAFARLARELSFGIVNRLAAVRMAEKRRLLPEVLARGLESEAFKDVYQQAARSSFPTTHTAYVQFLRCVFDELATDLGMVMASRAPNAILFPGEHCLAELLAAMNHGDLDALWADDEAIGWIYQYYNDPEERKLLKKSAPKDSRSLAIVNQFFTPRYVVEFLTDNTLGRTWYEMTKGETALKERCRFLVRRPQEIFLAAGQVAPTETIPPEETTAQRLARPEHIAHRPSKDPRALRFLDPACGSMHFGLYAFDLLEQIYLESWDRAEGTLRADYPEREAFLREVPRLILEQNIYGVDIDPRAVQIARLALWLRAQRAWQQQRVTAAKRPRIRKSHVVCAEPMPGNQQLLEEFILAHLSGTTENEILAKLLRRIIESMELAGEAGVLLRIEGAIANAVKQEKRRDQVAIQKGLPGLGAERPVATQSALPGFLIGGAADEGFWTGAETRLYSELARYSARLEQGGLQRRMFAEDAAQGLAFIDLCRERFDVVVMNPPFGEWSVGFKKQSKELYPNSYDDILCAFVERGGEMLHPGGYLGAITSRTCFFLYSYASWRQEVILKSFEPKLFVDLGHGVMDQAMVEAAAYVLKKN